MLRDGCRKAKLPFMVEFTRYLCFIVVDFIQSCLHRLKMTKLSRFEGKYISINRSDLLTINKTKIFVPRATAVILKILHPVKYPDLE